MENDKPRVSIGMPVYNGEKYLCEAIDSILNQTFSDFELIISDNGSSDRTEEICRSCAARDPRVRYYRNEENRGASWNFNRVFELSKGEYFKWVAADDMCAPELLTKCVEVLERDSSIILAYTGVLKINGQGKALGRDTKSSINLLHADSPNPQERFRYSICFFHSCAAVFGVVRSDVLRQTPLLANFPSSDRALLARLSLMGRFYEIAEPLLFWREHQLTSIAMYPLAYERAEWFDPTKKGKPIFPSWRLCFEYLVLIHCVTLKLNEKIVCYFQIARWLGKYWKDMVKDIVIFCIYLVRPGLKLYQSASPLRKYFFKDRVDFSDRQLKKEE